jgi:hypothetical protein
VTPGSTAPLVSLTIPLMALWALATTGARRRKATTATKTVRTLATPCMAFSFNDEAASEFAANKTSRRY